jgi:GxxExxY protein
MNENEVARAVIGAAIEVHRALGPGLLESVYEECLAMELEMRRLSYNRQRRVDVQYKGRRVAAELRIDLLVEDQVIVELKAVEKLLPVHGAQLLSYLRVTGKSLGLLINFNVPLLRDGVRRVVNNCIDLRVFASSR